MYAVNNHQPATQTRKEHATSAVASGRVHSYQTTCHSWIGSSRPLTSTAPIEVAPSSLSLTACQTVSEINDDIVRGMAPGRLTNLTAVPIFVFWLHGTMVLPRQVYSSRRPNTFSNPTEKR